MATLLARVRSAWAAVRRGAQLDADMHDEMRFHIELETERLMREQGLNAQEARRRACVAFGGLEKYKEAGRDARGVRWLDALALDARLGVRMLVKHRALTVIGTLALAIAIAIGAASFEIVSEAVYGTLPLDEGDRVVALVYATDNSDEPERRILSEFRQWRAELAGIQQLGAFRTVERNLLAASAHPEPVFVAEVTASLFSVARTPPLLGRYLVADDERREAPTALVIGHRVWQDRFGGDAAVLGRPVQLDGDPYVIVGVMPETFRFPVNHDYWAPLRADAEAHLPLQGPEIHVFGRLAPGVSMIEAQTELTTIGQRAAAANPQLYARMRPEVVSFTREHAETRDPFVAWLLWIGQVLVSGLVAVAGINVAILTYAHTMSRRAEMAMRAALGASRRRILGQLFLESFALTLLAAAVGLLLSQIALQQLRAVIVSSGARFIPYWLDLTLSPLTILYSVALAVAAAMIVGVLPGLKVTRHDLQDNLRELTGGTTLRLGRTWSSLIVAQVSVAVAVLPLAIVMVWKVAQTEASDPGFPVERFLVADVRFGDAAAGVPQAQLIGRLHAEPEVVSVTFSSAVPGTASAVRQLEFDTSVPDSGGELPPAAALHPAGILHVDADLFATYDARLIAGRTFLPGEVSNAVVVDRTFVRQFTGTRPVLGQRFRYTRSLGMQEGGDTPSGWYEIVGVVDDIPASPLEPTGQKQATVFHPAAAADVAPFVISVRLHGEAPDAFAVRLRTIAAAIDPAMRLSAVEPLAVVYERSRSLGRFLAWGLSLVTASVLLLSAAGIYALLSFTLAQRTREIGIRTALGAPPRRVVAGIFGRVAWQLAAGIVIGSLLSSTLLAGVALTRAELAMLLLIVPAVVTGVALFAAVGPTRRSLRLQTTEALRG